MASRTDRASIPLAEDVWLHESRTVKDGKVIKFRIHVQYEPSGRPPVPLVRYDSAHGGPHVHRYMEGDKVEQLPGSPEDALALCERDLYERLDEYLRIARRGT